MKNLVIVESPTKAKTIAKFLGDDFEVKSSFGHVRDLPKNEIGVEIDKDFAPRYVVPPEKKKLAAELKKAAKKAKEIFFATDSDREGEAISWHLAALFNLPAQKARRLIFHEITKEALAAALKHPRPLDLHLVDAQQARRVLDRLVGYELSPFLWKKVAKGLSAGRVQSAAVRLLVEREREIQSFKKEEYWTIEAVFAKAGDGESFAAKLHQIGDKVLEKMAVKSAAEAEEMTQKARQARYTVIKTIKKSLRRSPLPPFITSTLQQEANRRFGFSARQTMLLAQQLYEGVDIRGEGSVGLITYMRTDSVNLAEKFIAEARDFISQNYGRDYLSPDVRRFQTKSKLAQEAHEAVRPTEAGCVPEDLKNFLEPRLFKLYNLIWRRALSTQMAAAAAEETILDIGSDGRPRYLFRALGIQMKFDGFLKIYPNQHKENLLPSLRDGEAVSVIKIEPGQHFTEPPASYNDASLVKALEEHGIGRPSTYAPTIATILARQYAERTDKKRLRPTEIAFLVTDLFVKHFPKVVDYEFTAKMEDELDEVARGDKEWAPVVKEFYLPFHQNLLQKSSELTKKELTEEKTEEICEKCGRAMVIKMGRFGRFLACSDFPNCKNTRPLAGSRGGKTEIVLTEEKCPLCGAFLARRQGRYGEFVSCSSFPKCRYIKKELKAIGLKCSACGQGEIIEKRTRRGKIFYACSRYPQCRFALWQRPTGEKCPRCGSPLVYQKDNQIACSDKNCQ